MSPPHPLFFLKGSRVARQEGRGDSEEETEGKAGCRSDGEIRGAGNCTLDISDS